MQKLQLRFFDVQVEILSDSEAFLAQLARVYGRFQEDGPAPPFGSRQTYSVLVGDGNRWGSPVFVKDGRAWRAPSPEALTAYAGEAILHGAMRGVRTHQLIHAGAAAWQGDGVLLAADSGGGKTSLTLALVQRGFGFLSDEIGAIGRSDGRLHPFPRALRLRSEALALAPDAQPAAGGPRWLDIEALAPDSQSPAVPLRYVFVLEDGPGEPPAPNGSPYRSLEVLVSRLDRGLLEAVGRIEGVRDVRRNASMGFPEIRLEAADRMAALAEIEALCEAAGVLILNIAKRPLKAPDFSHPLAVERLFTSQAVMALLQQFQPGHRSALLQEELGGSPVRLFRELAGLLGKVSCFRLRGGTTEERAQAIVGRMAGRAR